MLHLCFQTALLGKTMNRDLGSPVKNNHKGGKYILYFQYTHIYIYVYRYFKVSHVLMIL